MRQVSSPRAGDDPVRATRRIHRYVATLRARLQQLYRDLGGSSSWSSADGEPALAGGFGTPMPGLDPRVAEERELDEVEAVAALFPDGAGSIDRTSPQVLDLYAALLGEAQRVAGDDPVLSALKPIAVSIPRRDLRTLVAQIGLALER